MASVTRTIKQKIAYRPNVWGHFDATKRLFNIVAAFYFSVIEAYPDVLELDSDYAMMRLERLTHITDTNPNPPMPLVAVAQDVKPFFRRAAIKAALGKAQSFQSNLANWRKEKEAFEAGKQVVPVPTDGKARGKKKATKSPAKFTKRPPVPPRTWNLSPTFYKGMYKDRTSTSIMLKLWTGNDWVWCKFALSEQRLEEKEWVGGSPQLVRHNTKDWRLHTPMEKTFDTPAKVEKQVKQHKDTVKICSVDLNLGENTAV